MGNILSVFRIIREEQLPFWIFLGVNLFFGAMALWVPPVIASQSRFASPVTELLKTFEQGNGYLFGLALLAAASSYWLREYLESNKTDFKFLKLSATLFAFALMIVMLIFMSIVIYSGFPSQPDDGHDSSVCIAWWPLLTQGFLTLLAVVTAAYLFCLERLDKYPEYGKALKDKREKDLQAGMDGQSKTGIST